jgi:DNA-binding response OmpR family regulator
VADVRMPEVICLELVEIVRSEDPTLPVLLVLGSEPEQVAARYGCFLRKPFSIADLTAKVHALLAHKRITTSAEP